ncbi:hypothetical protein [Microlunatus parietis]|uniref:Uncharacterized protein n=1 Tax=Microlunatus parietis TaxID=682979 RepID=A0A7Y9L8U7_9ACTN|nr:hypothetical protein [Microlunatus parietis]NYE68852.1 hypothetical protein [Microlunatus parietis]
MISWAVMGHPSRSREATALAWALGGRLWLDEDQVGENANGDRCWAAYDPAAAWHVVMQDDALPVADIARQAPAALAAAPAPVVSFYLGTNYPPATVQPARRAMAAANDTGSAWITAPRLYWGVAVAIRTDLIGDMLAAVRRISRPYDERISRWAETAGHSVAYTWPSLVDHADGPSTIPRLIQRLAPRRAYRVGRPTTWTTDPVPM